MKGISLKYLKNIINISLSEDIGKGDITAQLVFFQDKDVRAVFLSGESGVICGIDIVRLIFKQLDSKIRFFAKVREGEEVKKGQVIAEIYGGASKILLGERVALNILGFLSGIATQTRQFVEKIKDYDTKILDTRKTFPGLRELEKYAVRIGGAQNHRFKLDEMVLVKDNYIRVVGYKGNLRGFKEIINKNRKKIHPKVKIEIEVHNLKDFRVALDLGVDIIMLDNISVCDVRKAVIIKSSIKNFKTKIEASGNINLKNIRDYAEAGVDYISLGALTKNVQSLDLSLEVE